MSVGKPAPRYDPAYLSGAPAWLIDAFAAAGWRVRECADHAGDKGLTLTPPGDRPRRVPIYQGCLIADTLHLSRKDVAVKARARGCRATTEIAQRLFVARGLRANAPALAERAARLHARRVGGEYYHSPMCSGDSHYVLTDEYVWRFSAHEHADWRNVLLVSCGVEVTVQRRAHVRWAQPGRSDVCVREHSWARR